MSPAEPPRPTAWAAVHAAVVRAVRCRHALTAEAFADLLLERARDKAADRAAPEYVESLCLDDLYLAAACLEGDDQAWREFRDRYFEYVGSFARRFGSDATAREVRDQLIADLWQRRRLAQYDGRSTLRTWLGTLAAHAAINAGRAELRHRPKGAKGAKDAKGATQADSGLGLFETRTSREEGDPAVSRTFAAVVQRAIVELDAEAKLLLQLYYEQGLTLDEMSAILNLSKATLSRRLAAVRVALRVSIDAGARGTLHASSRELIGDLDLGRLEVDLSAALDAPSLKKKRGDGV